MPKTLLWAALAAAVLTGCAAPGEDRERVLLVTTTSVEASGLLDTLIAGYHAAQDRYRLAPTAVGSGAALRMGRRGDADVLLTHDPEGERAFARDGHVAEQAPIMMNRFIVAGPSRDPAKVAGAPDAVTAFRAIADARATFVSRGDDSGTHARERSLWRAAGLRPWEDRPSWYVESGSGMGETLQMAGQAGAYTLTDRATFLHMGKGPGLVAAVDSGPGLENHYVASLPVAPRNPAGARDLLAWLRGPARDLIAGYGAPEFGEPLFRPAPR